MIFETPASVSTAIYAYCRVMSAIHDLSSEALPVAWMRRLNERDSSMPGQIPTRETRRFEVVCHAGGDPRKEVYVLVHVEKALLIGGVELWLPEYAAVLLPKNKCHILCYYAEFDLKTGEPLIAKRDSYPYEYISA